MIRKDGQFLFYMIQHLQDDEKWVFSSFDAFGTPHKAFSASGRCWQETGENGTYYLPIAVRARAKMSKENREHKFRIVEVVIQQFVRPVNL